MKFKVNAGERLDVRAHLESPSEKTPVKRLKIRRAGSATLSIPAPAKVLRDRPILSVDLIDAAGDRAGDQLAFSSQGRR